MAFDNLLNGAVINVTGQASGIANQLGLKNIFEAGTTRVQFVDEGNGTILAFDAVINQSQVLSNTMTQFPVESGAVISDHIVQVPLRVTMTGIITDSPLKSTLAQYLTQKASVAAVSLLPPLGVTIASSAYAMYQAGTFGDTVPQKLTIKAYEVLKAMHQGDPASNPPKPPAVFTVVTKYARLPGMVMTDLEFPIDASTDGQLLANIALQHLNTVTPQVVSLNTLSNAVLAASKQALGSQDAEASQFEAGARAGDAAVQRAYNYVAGTNG